MNEKQQFLEKLRAALLDRDVSESDIQPYIERFDRIADNIAEQVSECYDEINRLAERTLTVDRVKDIPERVSESRPAHEPAGQADVTTASDTADQRGGTTSAMTEQPGQLQQGP